MSKIILLAAFIISCYFSVGQDSTTVSSLDEVIVTANKYVKKQTQTGKVVTVIGRDQLARSNGKTVGEVLNNVAGTTVIGSNSNLGTNLTVSMRGSTAGNVLILIDGIPVNDPSVITNYFDLNFVPVEQVERIEILKGGQSTLYGSDAVAGVINIITKKGGTPGLHGDVSVSAGSYNTLRANAGLNQSNAGNRFSLQYGFVRSAGFSSAYDSTGSAGYEKDGYHQHNLSGSWQGTLTGKLQANVTGLYSRYYTGVDASAFADEKDFNVTTDNLQIGGGLSYGITDGAIRLNYRYNKVNRLYLNDSADHAPNYLRNDFEGNTHFVELYASKRWETIELLGGIDYRHHDMKQDLISISQFGPYTASLDDSLAKMSQVSPYASLIIKADEIFNLEVGTRWNIHSEYGSNFSFTLNPSAFIDERVKLFLNLYSAYKTPTLYQLFDPSYGNRDLDPESSFNVEAGAQWFLNRALNVRGVFFYRNTNRAIEFIYTDPANYVSGYSNISNKKARGIELELEYKGERFDLSANFTHTTGRLKSPYFDTGFPAGKDTVINNLFRVPENVLNLKGGLRFAENFYAGITFRAAGKRQEPVYAAAPRELGSYYTVDVYGDYGISRKCKVFVDFRNITNQRYFEIMGYNARRFNFMGGVQLSL